MAGRLVFGICGNALSCQLDGWSVPEAGYTWSVGPQSRLRIPYMPGDGTLMLELDITPMLFAPVIQKQALSVMVNGIPAGQETIFGTATLGFAVPAEALDESHRLVVTLMHSGGRAPATLGANPDNRELAFRFHSITLWWMADTPAQVGRVRLPLPVAAVGDLETTVRFCTGLPVADLMHHFESLGHNCEFGLMQRAAGAEPLGLLRFSGMSPQNLLRGIDAAFEGIDDPAHLRIDVGTDGSEYMIKNELYEAQFHTDQFVASARAEPVAAKFARHLAYLRRQFEDVLGAASRVFIMHRPEARGSAYALPVLRRLRRKGPNVLLYVTEDRSIPAGTVVQERAHLYHGFIDTFAETSAMDRLNLGAWLSLCANTYRMWREDGGGAE
jgi:hypothetical protein